MDAFDVHELIARQASGEHTYEDFFRSERLSLGLSTWPVGVPDTQQPHPEDEVYYVIEGRGKIRVGDEDRELGPGSLVYVAAGVEHRFHGVEEELRVLVFWSPPRDPAAR
jgi:mannose-6-phosphate isomerase-like protein (cupin superfamily)